MNDNPVPVRLGEDGPIVGQAKIRKDGDSCSVAMLITDPIVVTALQQDSLRGISLGGPESWWD